MEIGETGEESEERAITITTITITTTSFPTTAFAEGDKFIDSR